jgi:8-oxo-dGTP pyrophosphatase MutT (NUDIX family)
MIQSAGIVVIDWGPVEPAALCVRAYSNWDFPKGKVDPGESLLQAAIRELQEETSIKTPADVTLTRGVAPSVTYGRGKRAKTATYFIGNRASDTTPFLPPSPELGRPENDEYRWVPISQLSQLMPPRLSPVVSFLINWAENRHV